MPAATPALWSILGAARWEADESTTPRQTVGATATGEVVTPAAGNPIAADDLTGLPPTTVYIGTIETLLPGGFRVLGQGVVAGPAVRPDGDHR